MNKKGQGLSLNMIIIGLIVVVVLIIIIAVTTGYFGKIFAPSVNACESANGVCEANKLACVNPSDTSNSKRIVLTAYSDNCKKQNLDGVCCSKEVGGRSSSGGGNPSSLDTNTNSPSDLTTTTAIDPSTNRRHQILVRGFCGGDC